MKSFATLFTVAATALTWQVVVDSTIKGLLLLVFASLAVVMMRRQSASARHLVWLVALMSLLLLPVLSLSLPKWRVLPITPADSPVPSAQSERSVQSKSRGQAELFLPAARPVEWRLAGSEQGVSVGMPTSPASVPSSGSLADSEGPRSDRSWTGTLVLAWALGLLVLSMRLAVSLLALRRLRRRSTPLREGSLVSAAEAAGRQLGLQRPVEIFLNEGRTMPMAWGIRKGAVLLPSEARDWDENRLRAVLLHELGHLQRHDPLVQLFVQIVCALHWFNPLVWLAAWRLHVERERACDDLVLQSGVKATDYAQHLLDVVAGYRFRGTAALSAVAMARRSRLEGRLNSIMSERLNRQSLSRRLVVITVVLGAALLLPFAMIQAQPSEPAPPPSPAVVNEPESPGVELESLEPVVKDELIDPRALPDLDQKRILEQLKALNRLRAEDRGESLKTRIEQYEEAFRLQTALGALFKKSDEMTPEEMARAIEALASPTIDIRSEGKEVSAWKGDRRLWNARLGEKIAAKPTMVGDNTVVVMQESGEFVGLDAKTGRTLWIGMRTDATPEPFTNPLRDSDPENSPLPAPSERLSAKPDPTAPVESEPRPLPPADPAPAIDELAPAQLPEVLDPVPAPVVPDSPSALAPLPSASTPVPTPAPALTNQPVVPTDSTTDPVEPKQASKVHVELMQTWAELVKIREQAVAESKRAHDDGTGSVAQVTAAQQALIEARIGFARASGQQAATLIALHEEQLRQLESLAALARVRYQAGQLSATEVQQARSKVIEAKIRLLELRKETASPTPRASRRR